jgi:LysR family glycine cleavage system transcriptional activator
MRLVLHKIPLTVLRNFEVAGRLGSFRAAADELGVSPSAISHAVAKLEDALGTALFIRGTRLVRLTIEGETLMGHLERGFEELRLGLEKVTRRAPHLLRVHSAPSFAAQWLAPRLPGFLAAHPGTEIRLGSGTDYARFKTDEFDADIIYGKVTAAGLITVPLAIETVMPLCAPVLAARIKAPADLLTETLIYSDNKQVRWQDWFTSNGLATPRLRGLRFDRSFLSISAAVDGQGVALESTLLAQRELSSGRLVAPIAADLAQNIDYCGHQFIYPKSRKGDPLIELFLAWLLRTLDVVV